MLAFDSWGVALFAASLIPVATYVWAVVIIIGAGSRGEPALTVAYEPVVVTV